MKRSTGRASRTLRAAQLRLREVASTPRRRQGSATLLSIRPRNTGTATRYDIRYSTSAITAGNFASASQASGEPLPQIAGTNQSFVVQGLSPSTTYYFAIKTADEALNWSAVSNSPSGTTSAAGGGGNETETFGYDFLDRLTSVAGAYTESYSYSQIGNMLTRNGVSYTYPTSGVRPHAVSSVGSTSYVYDNNGNMTTRGSQTITWDVENRPLTVTGGASFIYDGDGNRVKKTEGGQTVLYVNKYYEKNLTTAEITTYYYHGDKTVAKRTATTVQYIHQDHLAGSSVVSSSGGALVNSVKFYPFGSTRSGDVPTDKKFTGQRLDSTGLYYYGARYYDPSIGRFISPDLIVKSYADPQTLNRYAYVLNNPLKYVDPTGLLVRIGSSDPSDLGDLAGDIQTYTDLGLPIPDDLLQRSGMFTAGLGPGGIDVLNEWEILRRQEAQYTQHMLDSAITFSVLDVNSSSQTITYSAFMPGIVNLHEPIQMRFVSEGGTTAFMYTLMTDWLNAGGVSLYPRPIFIRTDFTRSTSQFTNLVAHETFHRWEQSDYDFPTEWLTDWYSRYIVSEAWRKHDDRPSEIRANSYANRYFPIP
jgi:RHS repeat-associated protein